MHAASGSSRMAPEDALAANHHSRVQLSLPRALLTLDGATVKSKQLKKCASDSNKDLLR